jgi:hypothetical protein
MEAPSPPDYSTPAGKRKKGRRDSSIEEYFTTKSEIAIMAAWD